MKLNSIKPAPGAKKQHVRVGRGIGSGMGKTCGRGHKGQRARAGGYHKVGFEGGQMPLQRRLPKFGFNSAKALTTAQVRLHELNKLEDKQVDMNTLRSANLITANIMRVKIIASGQISKSLVISNEVAVTAGAKAAIEAAGGKVEV